MTKGDLIEMLTPFTDDIEIMIAPDGGPDYHEVDHVIYGISGKGDGYFVLQIGAHRVNLNMDKTIEIPS